MPPLHIIRLFISKFILIKEDSLLNFSENCFLLYKNLSAHSQFPANLKKTEYLFSTKTDSSQLNLIYNLNTSLTNDTLSLFKKTFLLKKEMNFKLILN